MKKATVIWFGVFGGLLLMLLSFGATWGLVHGVFELGQWSGLYDWEITWQHSLFLSLAASLVRGLLTRQRSTT